MERQTVLIVDDSELNRMMLMEILGEQYHYIEAQNGREAVRLMEKKLTVDLMLLDINMPEMNGFQVLEQMNRFRWIDEIPVIMISTDETNQAIQQAYAMGVTDYIRRPFDTFIVRHRVENTLKLYANQKRLMYLVSDQIREKEENSNLMVGILSHVVEFRNHEGGDHIRNIRSITELLLRQLVKKTKDYHLSEEDIALIKTASALHDIGKITIPDAMKNQTFKKVYIMLGVNELGWASENTFIARYGSLLDGIREAVPDAVIYVQSILPVSKEKSDSSVYTNSRIQLYNSLIVQMCEEKGAVYLNVAEAVQDESGALPAEATVDGIHLKRPYYEKWKDYIMTHTVSG